VSEVIVLWCGGWWWE